MPVIRGFANWILTNKLRIFATLAATILFFVLLFPINDINDLVTTEVAKNTGNQVYVQFDQMNLGLFPPALSLNQLSLEMAQMPPLSIRKLEVRPSLLATLLQKIDAEASAEGLFRGDLKASVKPGRKMEDGTIMQAFTVNAERLNLPDIRKFASLPVELRGTLNLNANGDIDLAFVNQPDISFDLQGNGFELVSGRVESALGPVELPNFKLGRLQGKGRLSNKQLLIEELALGREGDDIFGTVRGTIDFELRNLGNGRVIPQLGNYEFKLDLLIKESFESRFTFIAFIGNHRQPEGDGGRYRVVLKGNAMSGMPPTQSPLR